MPAIAGGRPSARQKGGAVSYENLFAAHVLPIAKFRRTAPGQYEPIRAAGTGFTFGERTFITCWHCVSEPLGEGEAYCAAMRSEGTESQKYDEAFELFDLEQVRRTSIWA